MRNPLKTLQEFFCLFSHEKHWKWRLMSFWENGNHFISEHLVRCARCNCIHTESRAWMGTAFGDIGDTKVKARMKAFKYQGDYEYKQKLKKEKRPMGEIRELCSKGDSRQTWDPKNKDEVELAREHFNALIEKGFTAFSVTKEGEKHKRITKFNPKAGKIIMVPRMAGG